MATRLPASMRTREELTSLIEGRLSTASAKDELVKLATRLVVEEALEGEAGDAVGREYYEHGARPGQGYRNGIRPGRMKTAEGFIEYLAPQIAGRDEPFRSAIRAHLKGHTQALEGWPTWLRGACLVIRQPLTPVGFGWEVVIVVLHGHTPRLQRMISMRHRVTASL